MPPERRAQAISDQGTGNGYVKSCVKVSRHVHCNQIVAHINRREEVEVPIKRTRLIRNWRAKRLSACLIGVFALLICSVVWSSPARAAAAATGNQHACEVIGTDSYGNQAVICSDIDEVSNGGGTYFAQAGTEAACENKSGAIVQCANITVLVETAWAANGITYTDEVPIYGVCGHANGNCPENGKRFTDTGGLEPEPPVACVAEAWGVTLASNGNDTEITEIELPKSAANASMTLGDFGTPHTSIGNC